MCFRRRHNYTFRADFICSSRPVLSAERTDGEVTEGEWFSQHHPAVDNPLCASSFWTGKIENWHTCTHIINNLQLMHIDHKAICRNVSPRQNEPFAATFALAITITPTPDVQLRKKNPTLSGTFKCRQVHCGLSKDQIAFVENTHSLTHMLSTHYKWLPVYRLRHRLEGICVVHRPGLIKPGFTVAH